MTVLLVTVALFVFAVVGLQWWVRARARAMLHKPLPKLPGALGEKLRKAPSALVYFMTPTCGACRAWTPRLTALGKKQPERVFVLDATSHLELARALRIMATPSFIELQAGNVVGYHVGQLPSEVLGRFATA